MSYRRLTVGLLVLVVVLTQFPATLRAVQKVEEPSISAEAAIALDLDTGQILYEKNAHRRMNPASTTKIMTAVLVLENARLSDKVTIGQEPARQGGSSLFLKEGEKMLVYYLLYAALLGSKNDAACALAEHVAGTEQAFAELMNKRCREMGALNTQFANCTGFTAVGHYSTAYDLALIAREALQNRLFAHIVSSKKKMIHWADSSRKKEIRNTNRLLFDYEGALGVKTGTTPPAGECLVFTVERNGRRILGVTLKSKNRRRFDDATALLDHVFNSFTYHPIFKKGDEFARVPVRGGMDDVAILVAGQRFDIAVKSGEAPPNIDLKTIVHIAELEAPVSAGDKHGEILVFLDGTLCSTVDLVVSRDIPERTIGRVLRRFLGRFSRR